MNGVASNLNDQNNHKLTLSRSHYKPLAEQRFWSAHAGSNQDSTCVDSCGSTVKVFMCVSVIWERGVCPKHMVPVRGNAAAVHVRSASSDRHRRTHHRHNPLSNRCVPGTRNFVRTPRRAEFFRERKGFWFTGQHKKLCHSLDSSFTSDNCRDTNERQCAFWRTSCNTVPLVRSYCPRTCSVCTTAGTLSQTYCSRRFDSFPKVSWSNQTLVPCQCQPD